MFGATQSVTSIAVPPRESTSYIALIVTTIAVPGVSTEDEAQDRIKQIWWECAKEFDAFHARLTDCLKTAEAPRETDD